MKRLLAALLSITLLFTVFSFPATAAEEKVITAKSNISVENLRSKWKSFQPTYSGNYYGTLNENRPSAVAPYKLGKLDEKFLKSGLDMANFVRYASNLPDDLVLDSQLTNQAQHGAVLLAAAKEMTHTPAKPADMDESFYQIGYNSTKTSNINMGYKKLDQAVLGFMSDSSASNVDRVGHRRWITNPQLKKIGFGLAQSESNSTPYGTMQVFDNSRAEKVDYDLISWPAYGYHPLETFEKNDPWSVSLNPEKFDKSKTSDIRVKLTDNKGSVIEFGPNDTNKSGKYFNVETGGYGIPFCIIFRPMQSYAIESSFDVEITGVYEKGGTTPVTVKYSTEFVSMEDSNSNTGTEVYKPPYEKKDGINKFNFDNQLLMPFPAVYSDTQKAFDLESLRGKNTLMYFWEDAINSPKVFSYLAAKLDKNVQLVFVNVWFSSDRKATTLRDFLGREAYDELRKYPNWIELSATNSNIDGFNTVYRYLGNMYMTLGCGLTGSYVYTNSDLKYGVNVTGNHLNFGTAYEDSAKYGFDIPIVTYPKVIVDASGLTTSKINAHFRNETSFTYSVDDPSIATVSSDGTVKGLKQGGTKVRVGAKGAKGTFEVTVEVTEPKYSDIIVSGDNSTLLPSELLDLSFKTVPENKTIIPDSITFDAPFVRYDAVSKKVINSERKYGKVTGTVSYANMTKTFTINYVALQPASDPLTVKFLSSDSDTASKKDSFSLNMPKNTSAYRALAFIPKWKITDSSTEQTPKDLSLTSVKVEGNSIVFYFDIKKGCTTKSITVSNPENNLTYTVPVSVTISQTNEPEKPIEPTKPIETPKPTATQKPTPTPTTTPPVGNYLTGTSDWAKSEVKSAKEAGLTFDGVLNNYQKNITRAEFCKLVVNFFKEMGGEIPAPGTSPFQDTSDSDILIANKLGIVNGVSDTQFDPNADITREQISAMMMRAIKKFDTPNINNDLTKFSDYNQISSYAVESLSYLNQIGIIKGMSDTKIAPLENTTREQAILIVYRTFDSFEVGLNISNGTYKFITATNTANCIGIGSSSVEDGANAITWANLPVDDQKFKIEKVGDKYSIKAVHSGKALTPNGEQKNGTTMVQQTFTNSPSQLFDIVDAGNGYISLISSDGYFVSVSAGSDKQGANIILWQKTGNTSQKFKLIK